jgi:hypothetical protein
MSFVGSLKFLGLSVVLTVCCAAQTTSSSGSIAGEVRPAIIQRGAQSAQIVASPAASGAQVTAANFHVASGEEIEGMEQTLERYVVAFESLQLSKMQEVWPSLDKQHVKAFKNAFAAFQSSSANPRLGLQCAVPRVTEDTANVECLETVTYSVGKGKTKEAGPAKVSIQLKGQSRHWVLEDMKGVG